MRQARETSLPYRGRVSKVARRASRGQNKACPSPFDALPVLRLPAQARWLLTIAAAVLISLQVESHLWKDVWNEQTESPVVVSGSARWHGSSLVVTSRDGGETYALRLPSNLSQERVHKGDYVVVHGMYAPPRPASNPGAFDARGWMIRNGWAGYIHTHRIRILHAHPQRATSLETQVERIHDWIQHRLDTLFNDGHIRALMMAMISGDRSNVTDEVTHAFRLSGLSHLLAISGLHFSIVLGLVWLLAGSIASRLPIRNRLRRAVTCMFVVCAAVAFASVTGWTASVVRSFLMVLVTAVALALGRAGWLERSLILAALAITLHDAGQWRSMGMQLSFGAVAGIAIFLRLSARYSRSRVMHSAAGSAMVVTLGAFSGTAPVLLSSIGWVPLIGLLVSPLAIVLTSIALTATVVAVMLPLGAEPLAFVATLALDMVLNGAYWIANTDFMLLRASSWKIGSFAIIVFGALLASIRTLRTFWRTMVSLVVASALVWSLTPDDRLELTTLDVGQGDAMIITLSNTSPLVVDTGPGPMAGRVITSALAQSGHFGADVLLTHGDRDHIGGLSSLEGRTRVGTTSVPWSRNHPQAGTHIEAGDRLKLPSSVRGYVLHPVWPGRSNAHSIVALVVFGTRAVLITGDIHTEQEREILRRYGPLLDAVDLIAIKVPHHGSRTSSSERMLSRLKPIVAIVSAGARNRFDHPHQDVVARYENHNITLLNTASIGAIRLSMMPQTLSIASHEDGRWNRIELQK